MKNTLSNPYSIHTWIGMTLLLLLPFGAFAQAGTGTVKGKVIDATTGESLIGANVQFKGTTKGTSTNLDGEYTLYVTAGTYKLVASFVGMGNQEKPITITADETITVNFELSSDGIGLEELVVIGSRNQSRTAIETPVPVDVIDVAALAGSSAQVTVNDLLNYVAPSFTSNKQTISDGTDHIDPASLRGLGPDQVLVLINGKRRHNSSLVNVNGTFGRGAVGTDMNAIPVAAIARIEVLRDGAAAQYGSDAIAGVINIVLKTQTNKLDVSMSTGAYISKESEDGIDGEMVQISMNYGLPIGDKGGYINFTGNFDNRDYTSRSTAFTGSIFSDYNNPTLYPNPTGADITEEELVRRGLTRDDFKMRVGQSAVENAGAFFNASVPLKGDNAEFYAFGGLTYRNGEAAGFYRRPNQSRTVTDIYPNGFLPEIHSDILDKSLAMGIRGELNGWNIDFSNVYGSNGFTFRVENSLNASLETASPTSFDAGGFQFAQNTTNFDISRYFDEVASGFNLAFGAEYRIDNYQIFAGEEASYYNYGLASEYTTSGGETIVITDGQGPVNTVFDPLGRARPGGAQVFPGFSPNNEVDAFRSTIGLYADAEIDFSEQFFMTSAIRYERYSDFGDTFNAKLSFRYNLSEKIGIRGAASTGFRAPSLHQQNYNSTSTLFVDGEPFEVGTFSNDSRAAKVLGIPQLKQETSTNFSLGFTGELADGLTLTVDGYMVDIADRIVYTDQFRGTDPATGQGTPADWEVYELLRQANANRAAFFANAIDTRTSGVDIVLTHGTDLGAGKLATTFAGTFSQTKLQGDVNTSTVLAGKEDTYFSRTSQIYLESAVPRVKFNLTFNYQLNKLGIMLRNVYFGPVDEATNNPDNAQTFTPKVVTDLSFTYKISKQTMFVIGANNLLDVYPDRAIAANQGDGQFIYSRRAQQFGFNGRYLFTRLVFNF